MHRDVPWFSSARWRALAAATAAICASLLAGALATGCAIGPVFPAEVQHAFARDEMRVAETEHLRIYYPARRRAEVERFAARAEACAAVLKGRALLHGRAWAEKMTLTMPETAYNNAYVSSKLAGSPDISVVPTYNSLDFSSEFGLPPDPGYIACHELVHYVQMQQIAGLWSALNWLGDLYSPQVGFDAWVFEGLATYYEASLQPGAGRPRWPVFTGMFAAAYAGRSVRGGDLAAQGRKAPVGHHYLVGSMFVRFLVETYGERAMWQAIASQAKGWTGLLSATSFSSGFGKSLSALLGEFDAWQRAHFPVRPRPAAQRRLSVLGNDARYARGRDGSEAWVADDLDQPTKLVVRGPDGTVRAELSLVDIAPPRRLIMAAPLLVSGLSISDDGREVWLTAIDYGAVAQTTRLLRWRDGEGLREVASGLGPGLTVDGAGRRYFFAEVDGDRWSLAVYDVASRARRTLLEAAPGTYVLGGQLSPDGRVLAASAWNGAAFVVWLIDAQSGQLRRELRGDGPLFDPSFLDDGRLLHLRAVDGRFQIELRDRDGDHPRVISDAPYAVLAPRGGAASVRFLNREGWSWTLDELPAPPAELPAPAEGPLDPETGAPTPTSAAGEPAPAAATPTAPTTTASAAASSPPAGSPLTPPSASAAAPSPPATAPLPPPSTTNPAATLPAISPPGSPASPPPSLLRDDRPYSAWSGFFFPALRAPFSFNVVDGDPHAALILGGSDVLGLHRWQLTGLAQLQRKEDADLTGDDAGPYLGVIAAYANNMLAPWAFAVEASSVHGVERVAEPMPGDDDFERLRDRKTRDLTVAFGRSWRETWTAVAAFTATDDRIQPLAAPGEPALALDHRQLGGPALSLAYFGGETTAYTGLRRALAVSADAAHFPERFSSLGEAVTSARAGLGLVAPLPFTRRHILSLELAARGIFPGQDLIELGGTSAYGAVWERSSEDEPAQPEFVTPDHLRLLEPLRGYEDTTFAVARVASGELSWRYPLILDRGVASLWWLPSMFARQLDLELFAAGALTEDRAGASASHLAAGAAAILRVDLFRIPLAVRYQLSRRLRDDRALLQVIGIGVAL